MPDKIDTIQNGMSDESLRLIVSPSAVAAETFLYAQEVGYLEVGYTEETPSYSAASDCLDSFLIILVTRGKVNLIYEGKEVQLKKRDFAFLDCKKYHKYYAIETSYCNFLYLYFNGNQAAAYYKYVSENKTPILNIDDYETLMSLFWQIISLHRKYDCNAELLTSMYITRILTEICLLCKNESVSSFEYPDYIKIIFHKIDHLYKEKITLDMLAQHCGVNKFHIARGFKQYTGTTIHEHLITTRINKAKSLLRFTSMNIEQIAVEIGFCGTSHFIKLFKDREHLTPFYYRKQWKS